MTFHTTFLPATTAVYPLAFTVFEQQMRVVPGGLALMDVLADEGLQSDHVDHAGLVMAVAFPTLLRQVVVVCEDEGYRDNPAVAQGLDGFYRVCAAAEAAGYTHLNLISTTE